MTYHVEKEERHRPQQPSFCLYEEAQTLSMHLGAAQSEGKDLWIHYYFTDESTFVHISY
jgi:hypothetical protein